MIDTVDAACTRDNSQYGMIAVRASLAVTSQEVFVTNPVINRSTQSWGIVIRYLVTRKQHDTESKMCDKSETHRLSL
jgi:hypothetical protein